MTGSENQRLLNVQSDGGSYDAYTRQSSATEPTKDQAPALLQVYKRRWYILIMYGLFSFVQNAVCNTWGPISTTAIDAFNWTDATIAAINNWGPISYILVGLVYPWLMQIKGLRMAVVSSTLLMAVGTSVRVFTSDPGPATVLFHIGQFFNGLAGPVGMGAITQLTADWFPTHERVTATALGTSISMAGGAAGFVLGPLMVRSPSLSNTSSTTVAPSVSTFTSELTTAYSNVSSTTLTASVSTLALLLTNDDANSTSGSNQSLSEIDQERGDIMKYMYLQCGSAWLVTIAILIYYPSKPPNPPCLSASTDRDKYWSGLWSLRKKTSFLVVAVIYGVSLGVLEGWTSVLNINLHTVDVSESTSGWIGCYSTIAACLFSLLIGRFADYFKRNIKFFILVLFLLGASCFLVFALMLIKVVNFSNFVLYFTIIGGTCFMNGTIPLMFELACELAYPTSEGAANGLLTYINNVGGLIFLGVFSVPGMGTMWMNWALIASTVICVPLIAMLRGSLNRLEVDEGGLGAVQREIIT